MAKQLAKNLCFQCDLNLSKTFVFRKLYQKSIESNRGKEANNEEAENRIEAEYSQNTESINNENKPTYEIIERSKNDCSQKFTCETCDRQFPSKGEYKAHVERHKNKKKHHECSKCKKLFLTSVLKKKHKCNQKTK